MPLDQSITALVHFDTAPFPYDGLIPATAEISPNEPFLDISANGRRGHTSTRAGPLWEDQHYSDDRTLLFMPGGFDPQRPATLVVFFHGNDSTLERDVIGRQRVHAQVEASGLNAILAAPQFAFDAPDSSAGGFWRPQAFRLWLTEVAEKLAAQLGDDSLTARFQALPVLLVAYSGGYNPAAYALTVGRADDRICGVVLLDGLYGEEEKFADWIEQRRTAFFVSAFTDSSAANNELLQSLLQPRGIAFTRASGDPRLTPRTATFLAVDDAAHDDFVTRAWRDNPIQWLLNQLAGQNYCAD